MSIVDFVIHLNPELPLSVRTQLESEIGEMDGALSAHFSQRHPHMMEVAYDPEVSSSNVLLKRVVKHSIVAQ